MEPKKIKNPTGMLIMHGTVIAVVLYMAWQLVRSYRAGGAEAPSLTTLIVGLVLLVGGCVVLPCGFSCRQSARKRRWSRRPSSCMPQLRRRI